MTDHDKDDMKALDEMIAQVSRTPVPEVSEGLMARILRDAETAIAATPATVATPAVGWRDWLAALGGWPSMGGLVAAGVAGLWIGVAPTGTMADLMAGVLGETVSVELFPDVDLFELEVEG